jgi:hypothetical protein
MAVSYYGYTISPNQIETGEGFLICRNVPIARTGEQEYLGTEIGLNDEKTVKVFRPPEEVFSEAAMASFDGKPVTNNHSPDLLDPETASMYEKGHAQNVRKGEGEWDGYLIADLHIHDAELIRDIKNGKRHVSCGYECEYTEDGDRYTQSEIRGNHVAVVELGRAGSKAAIMDSINKPKKAERKMTMNKKSTFLKLFGMAANGKNDEELTQMAMDAAENLVEETEVKTEEETKEEVKDIDPIAEVSAKLDKLIDILTKEEVADETVEEVSELDEAIEKLEPQEEKGGEEAVVVPAEEMDGCGKDGCKAVSDSVAAYILKSVKPSIVSIEDEKVRKAVSDALIEAVGAKTDDIVKVMDAQASYQSKSPTADIDAVQNAYANLNPHTKKEDK